MTIYEIKQKATNAGHFFDRKTLKFFGQTLESFHVWKLNDGIFKISAPITDFKGIKMGQTERYFNSKTNKLFRKLEETE